MIVSKLRRRAPERRRPLWRVKAIDFRLRHQLAEARHDAISAFAAEMAGTSLDLDDELEAAAVEHLVKAGKASK
jgi:hypothetical protein